MIYREPTLKKILLKIKYGPKSNSESYIKYLRKKGIKIGNNVEFNSPWTTIIDYAKPWLVTIGDNVIISSNVSIISHGADWRILQNLYGNIIGSGDQIKIGDNVFIGIGTIILKNVNIGDNVIIGAGSVVTKNLNSNGVYAGNPAKYIMSLEEYYNKRLNLQDNEFLNNIKAYKKRYGEYPQEDVLKEYFFLFKNKNDIKPSYISKMFNNGMNPRLSEEKFCNSKKIYESYENAIEKVMKDEQ